MKKLLFLCFLVLVSCASHHQSFAYITSKSVNHNPVVQNIWIDNAFGEADRNAIQDALDQWTYALNGYMVFKTQTFNVESDNLTPFKEAVEGKAWAFLKIDGQNKMLTRVDHRERGEWSLAFTEVVRGNLLYIVRDRIQNDQVAGITMHEMGHLLGAQHVDDSNSLMNAMYNNDSARCIDKKTLEQVSRSYGFPMANLNYCIYF